MDEDPDPADAEHEVWSDDVGDAGDEGNAGDTDDTVAES